MAISPLIAGLTNWGNGLYVAVLDISIFTPLVFGLLGLIFAFIGIKGKIKVSLVLVNVLGISLSLFLAFIAFWGFKQP
jgi:hypothetical protein